MLPGEAAIARLERNHEGAVQRSRSMPLEGIAPIGDESAVGLPIPGARTSQPEPVIVVALNEPYPAQGRDLDALQQVPAVHVPAIHRSIK